jgi:hypothetical protein
MFRFFRVSSTIWLILSLIILIETISFRGQNSKLDILHVAKCKLPCWNGIIPGKTTVREAKDKVLDQYNSEIFEAVAGEGFVTIFDRSTKSRIFRVVMSVPKLNPTDSDILSELELQFDPSFNLLLGDIFVSLDRPQYVVLWGLGGGVFPALIYEDISVVVTVVRPAPDLSFCTDRRGLVGAITIFSQAPPKSDWVRYEPQIWRYFGACFRWIDRFD